MGIEQVEISVLEFTCVYLNHSRLVDFKSDQKFLSDQKVIFSTKTFKIMAMSRLKSLGIVFFTINRQIKSVKHLMKVLNHSS